MMSTDRKPEEGSVELEEVAFSDKLFETIPDVPPSPEAEAKLLRKLDIVILPWIMLMYFLSYMDRCELCYPRTANYAYIQKEQHGKCATDRLAERPASHL